tara:strand:- start:4119 stop:5366 length:1248 start_codon:yes stop_codon:yes gene_type:complete
MNISKSFHGGWSAESEDSHKGFDYQITTFKRGSGKVTTVATPGIKNGNTFSFDLFGNPGITLNEIKVSKVTKKLIEETHLEALAIFDKKKEEGVLKENENKKIGFGQILFLDGYGKTQGSEGNKHIVYKVEGDTYFTVEADTLSLQQHSFVKPFDDKFGIGVYYIEGDVFKGSEDELNNLVLSAHQKKKDAALIAKKEQEINDQIICDKIAEGKDKVSVPSWAKAVIVADLYQDDSDSMTDYFATSVQKRVYLSFSKSERNNMKELEKASQHFEETKDFPEQEDFKYTYGHHLLPDYYLGSQRWSGYKVHKISFNHEDKNQLNKLFVAAAEERFLIPSNKAEIKLSKQGEHGAIIFDYSEKAIAVIGDTKPLKEGLKALGGRFNFRLSCGAGWIFPKTKLEEVESFLGVNSAVEK